MDQNDNKNKRGGGKGGGNWRGVIQLVCWALLLTIVISYASSYMNSAGRQSSSVELEYKADFLEMLERGDVAAVDFDNSESILIITPVDGYVYTDGEGRAYTKTTLEDGTGAYTVTDELGQERQVSLRLFTVQLIFRMAA